MANYSFVIDSSFKPFSMQEMLVPFQMYKDAFEKTEDAYMDLSQKADTFKYLSETLPEDSKARKIYEGYANGLAEQAEDLAQNGLSMANRRALTSYKRRYQGEIGRLNRADEALQEERKRRLALSSNDSSTLYANDNISIDDFLDNNKPNLYSVSGNDLYKRGLEIGASGSSRMYSDPKVSQVTDYYQDIFNTQGITPEAIAAFRRDLSTIPEFADAVTSTLKEKGVTDNLTGSNYERAKESVINGIVNGAIYKRNDSIQRDYSVMTASEAAANQRQKEQNKLEREKFNYMKQKDQREENFFYTHDANGNRTGYNTAVLGDGENVPNGFYRDPNDGKLKRTPKGYKPDTSSPTGLVKDDSSGSSSSKQEKYDNKLLALKSDDLANNKGFDVQANGNRYHYNYIGAIAAQNGGWVSGAIGDDVPHRGWGFTSSSNVMNARGNFSAEGADDAGKKGMRVLSTSEMQTLLANNPELSNEIGKRIKAANVDPNSADIQIIEVPNEKGNARKGYLIAVHQ